jgi:hypothetical protein
MVIHFGINPVSGGSPPNDRSMKGIIICSKGDWRITLFMLELNEIDFMWKITNSGIIISEYIKKYVVVRRGL